MSLTDVWTVLCSPIKHVSDAEESAGASHGCHQGGVSFSLGEPLKPRSIAGWQLRCFIVKCYDN